MMYDLTKDPFSGDRELSWDESGSESPQIYDALEIYMYETYWAEEIPILPILFLIAS